MEGDDVLVCAGIALGIEGEGVGGGALGCTDVVLAVGVDAALGME